GGIALLDGVEDRAIPDVDAVLEADIGDDQEQQSDREHPCQPVAALAPIPARADPESRQQILLARVFGFFRRQLGIGLDDLGRRRLDLIAIFSDDLDDLGLLLARRLVVVWLLVAARRDAARVLAAARFGFGLGPCHKPITRTLSKGSCAGTVP